MNSLQDMEDALRTAGWSECETLTRQVKFIWWAKLPDQAIAGDLFWVDCYVLADAYRVMKGEDDLVPEARVGLVPEARVQLRKKGVGWSGRAIAWPSHGSWKFEIKP